MGARRVLLWGAFRLLLPACSAFSIFLRQNVSTAFYLVVLLCLPLLRVPAGHSIRARLSRVFLWAVIVFSSLLLTTLLVFQFGFFDDLCLYGLVKFRAVFDGGMTASVGCHLLPLSAAAVTLLLIGRRPQLRAHSRHTQLRTRAMARWRYFYAVVGTVPSMALLALVGCLHPTLPNLAYLVAFLAVLVVWAMRRPVARTLVCALRCACVVAAVHLVAMFTVELQLMQTWWPNNDELVRRVLGLNWIKDAVCKGLRVSGDTSWERQLNPHAVMLLYHVAMLQARNAVALLHQLPSFPAFKDASREASTSISTSAAGSINTKHVISGVAPGRHGTTGGRVSILGGYVWWLSAARRLAKSSSSLVSGVLMMTWAIAYHSLPGLGLLLLTITFWMLPRRSVAIRRCMPFVILYTTVLLLVGYACNLNLHPAERTAQYWMFSAAEVGLPLPEPDPVWNLLVKGLFILVFAATMRHYRNKEDFSHTGLPLLQGAGGPSAHDASSWRILSAICHWLVRVLTTCWLWLGALIPLAIRCGDPRIIVLELIYATFFLAFVLTYQLSYRAWRASLLFYWLLQMVAAIDFLLLAYLSQFEITPKTLHDQLGLSMDLLFDLGLKNSCQTFSGLVPPAVIFVITALQLQFFHHRFMDQSHLIRWDEDDKTDAQDSIGKQHKPALRNVKYMSAQERRLIVFQVYNRVTQLVDFVWLVLDLHVLKIMLLNVIFVCLPVTSVLHLFLVFGACGALMFARRSHLVTCHALSVLVSLLLLLMAAFQLRVVEPPPPETDNKCEMHWHTKEWLRWLGLHKTDSSETTFGLFTSYLWVVFLATISAAVRYRRHRRPEKRVMFPEVTRLHADRDVKTCIKFFFNYGFYKFGVELTLIAVGNLIVRRMDMVALLYAAWLCVLTSFKRKRLSRIWPAFHTFTTLALVLQYASAVGFPPGFCFSYPWAVIRNMQGWMFLPADDNVPIDPDRGNKLIWDVLVMLLACRQMDVFRVEQRERLTGVVSAGGSNGEVSHLELSSSFVNPVPNHMRQAKSCLDVWKRFTMSPFYVLVIFVLMVASFAQTSIFSLGYLLGSFTFLWMGDDLHLRPVTKVLLWWKMLLGYNVFVMFAKMCIQIPSCFFYEVALEHACPLVQLLHMGCVTNADEVNPAHKQCDMNNDPFNVDDDVQVFIFLLIQRRIFYTYYYLHHQASARAMNMLASRGAELIEEHRANQIAEQRAEENALMENIRVKAEQIASLQRREMHPALEQSETHHTAIRAGDYYMFSDAVEEKLDEEDEGSEDLLQEVTLGKLLGTAYQTDLENAADFGLRERQPPPQPRASTGPSKGSQRHQLRSRVDGSLRRRISIPTVSKSRKLSVDTLISGDSLDLPHKKPSTDETGSMQASDGEESSQHHKGGCWQAIWTFIKFLWALVESSMSSLSRLLNRSSSNYRIVYRVLTVEKEQLMDTPGFDGPVRQRTMSSRWRPTDVTESSRLRLGSGPSKRTVYRPVHLTSSPKSTLNDYRYRHPSLDAIDEVHSRKYPAVVRLLLAIWNAFVSNSDILCYSSIILQQASTPSLLSLVMVLMVFLWGTLTIPRPTKTFWVVLISYAQVCLLMEFIFTSPIMWSVLQQHSNQQPKYATPVNIIGVGKELLAGQNFLVLLCLGFHRLILKSRGLWTSLDSAEVRNNREATQRLLQAPALRLSSRHRIPVFYEADEETGDEDHTLAARRSTDSSLVLVRTTQEDVDDHLPGVAWKLLLRYLQPTRDFFAELVVPYDVVRADVYPYIVFCDFINILVVVFGFSQFGGSELDGSAIEYLLENRVPPLFLVMLLSQFLLVVVERALYLRKNIRAKVALHLMEVICVHVGIFYMLPLLTEEDFGSTPAPVIWYMVRCISLLLSAYQIRCGYPTRVQQHFLCHKPGYLNMIFFQLYRVLPFIYDMRALMGWIWTDTSFSLYNWMCMEDCFARVFVLKCFRQLERNYPTPRGERQRSIDKCLSGGILLFVIIAVIWFPLIWFSLGGIGEANPPISATFSLQLGPFEPLYTTHITPGNGIYTLTTGEFTKLQARLGKDWAQHYDIKDTSKLVLRSSSNRLWGITMPERTLLLGSLNSPDTVIDLTVTWEIERQSSDPLLVEPKVTGVEVTALSMDLRRALIDVLGNSTVADAPPIVMDWLFPRALKVRNKGRAYSSPIVEKEPLTTKLSLALKASAKCADAGCPPVWWQLTEDCPDPGPSELAEDSASTCPPVEVFTFSEKQPILRISSLSRLGILGLYISVVFVVHRLVRLMFYDLTRLMMLSEMPNVDRIYQLLIDIYVVRENRDFRLEEDLFAKLVFLFRSPETLILYTRPRELQDQA